MGTINLARGNIITLGYVTDEYISDDELREWATEEFGINEYLQELYTLEGYIKLRAQEAYSEMIFDWEYDCASECKSAIDRLILSTDWIGVRVEPGYYSGFSVVVNIEPREYFDDYNEKEMAMDDVKDVQKLLEKLLDNYGVNVVYPGWVETWLNYEESKKAIKKAMAELRRQIKAIPCWSRYRKVV
jgi:hypothetical protein